MRVLSILPSKSNKKEDILPQMSDCPFKALVHIVMTCTYVAISVLFGVLPVLLVGLYVLRQSPTIGAPPPPKPTHLPRVSTSLVHLRFLLQQLCFCTVSTQTRGNLRGQ